MSQALQRFAAQCRSILLEDPGPAGRERVRRLLEAELRTGELARAHLGPENHAARTLLYEDPDLGFCILAHAHDEPKGSEPHDHGPSWAIYGQAAGTTEMTDWRAIRRPQGDEPGVVEEVRRYELRPGMARLYNEGDLHSPLRRGPTRLIRIEGTNMERVKRDRYVVAEAARA